MMIDFANIEDNVTEPPLLLRQSFGGRVNPLLDKEGKQREAANDE